MAVARPVFLRSVVNLSLASRKVIDEEVEDSVIVCLSGQHTLQLI